MICGPLTPSVSPKKSSGNSFADIPLGPEGVKKFNRPPHPPFGHPFPQGGEGVKSRVYVPLAPVGRGARGEGASPTARHLEFFHISPLQRGNSSFSYIRQIAILLLLCLLPVSCQKKPQLRNLEQRLIILGFDGVDPGLLKDWMSAGHLPNIQKLSAQGTFQKLGTTNPPESPVAWASFATGLNPGKHGIFDFLRRNPENYFPEIALVNREPAQFLFNWVPVRPPRVTNNRAGTPFYKTLADFGIKTTVLRMPLEFPPTPLPNGKILGGLSIPDVRGTWGTFFYFASDLTRWEVGNTEFGGKLVRIELNDNAAKTEVEGPADPTQKSLKRISIPLRLELDRERNQVKISLQGQEETVAERKWSRWFNFTFRINAFLRIHGTGRFCILETFPELKVYLSPINFDPRDPPLPVSFPSSFSRELAAASGLYKTLGWAHDTWSLNEEKIDEEIFLQDVFETMDKYAALLYRELKADPAACTVAVFTATDSVSHVFYRLIDPHHPRYDARLAEKYGDAILRAYRKMDEIIGQVMKQMNSRTTLMVVSDHGFHTWRKGFNTNTWLVENGFMKLKGSEDKTKILDDLFSQGSFFPNVDWERTQAYALGLGQIYINLKGREKEGIVKRGTPDYDSIRTRIIEGLKNSIDPDNGEHIIQDVYKAEEIFKGPQASHAADLQISFRSGYRTSWQTSLGAVPAGVVVANLKKWSGDHCASDASDTQGIFLCNRTLPAMDRSIMDVAPTALKYFGAPVSAEIDGKAFGLAGGID
jgi:predicted AlkP superfamily phosphohydrolase/phosphomutase